MGEMTGGEVLANMLNAENVEKVFGIIDGTYFGFYSSLKSQGIELITPRHETSAAHMAGAYARISGKLGVCMASNGPGVANILPGLVVEEGEGNRVLVITSARRTGIMYPDRGGTYQCFDQTGVISKIAKWSQAVPSFDRIPEMMRTALRKCFEGRPGVVHIDIPENIINSKQKCDISFWKPSQYRVTEMPGASDRQLSQAADLLINAEYPIIHAGSGVIHAKAYEEVETAAALLQSMVTTSWAARGAIPETNPLMLPMIHIATNNKLRNEADVVLVLGSRLGETDWWGKAPYWNSSQKVIQVDLDPGILGANKPVELAIQADVKTFLSQLNEHLYNRKEEIQIDQRKVKNEKIIAERDKNRKKLDQHLEDMSVPMNPAQVPSICQNVFPKDTTFVLDGGNTVIWSNFFYQVNKPGSVISTYKFGMLGAGPGQALGAAAANREQPVCCIIGDGAMGFHPQEVETAVRNGLQVIFIVMCDKQWGMVKMNQQFALKPVKTLIKKSLSPEETINADLGVIQFDRLAQSMGAHGEHVNDPKDLKTAIERSLETGRCSVIHVDVDPVKHMWAPGLKYFKDMHQEPKGK
ncbi:thiamine pyrophosphate-binding protein [Rossellomorea vietnamensis]|uniref:Thiamine pyrophosphate-binding protein n=1 Tax=Rossellomorea vietnamensis TaxID=218284 RepID=A0A5D4MEC9_9BACI|nr:MULTISPECIES: thiamine pyrophosphate-binding protein [Bacillaceae]TYR99350.1 thiamine pyrophosphate-binding protein [Rossellomorea vietnamensis]